MFTVYVVASDNLRRDLVSLLESLAERALIMGSATDVRLALSECARDNPGVLLLDDALLMDDPDLVESLAGVPYPIVLLANPEIPSATRRALALRAKDLIPLGSWREEIIASLERVATPLYHRDKNSGKTIAVFSPKGGVGKTSLSVNLAAALAERTHQTVVIVDLDLVFGDASAMLGLSPKSTIHDALDTSINATRLEEIMVPFGSHVLVLAAPLRPEEAEDVTMATVVKILQVLRENYPYVVLDMAPGYDDINVAALDSSDIILTVCTPDVVTLRTVGQALHLFREDFHYPAEKVRLVLNRSGSNTGIKNTDIVGILHHTLAYELPSAGPMPVRAANQGVPFVTVEPLSGLSQAVSSMAEDIARQNSPVSGRSPLRSMRRDVLSRLRRGR